MALNNWNPQIKLTTLSSISIVWNMAQAAQQLDILVVTRSMKDYWLEDNTVIVSSQLQIMHIGVVIVAK